MPNEVAAQGVFPWRMGTRRYCLPGTEDPIGVRNAAIADGRSNILVARFAATSSPPRGGTPNAAD